MEPDSPNTPVSEMGFLAHHPERYSERAMCERSTDFLELLKGRRSVRSFSDRAVPYEVIKNALAAANTAPSGANKQPWVFCLVSNQSLKKEIRILAEQEEYESYNGRMNEEWLDDLKPLGTSHEKPFLESAPYLIIVFKKPYDMTPDDKRTQNYYVNESIGIATGFLLLALHNAGISSLTHTPSPMNFLGKLLNRPANERPFMLIPVGYASDDCEVPNISKKPINSVLVEYK